MIHRHKAKAFSDIHVGDRVEFEIIADEKRHNFFSKLFEDFNSIHCDDEFSSKTKFGRKIGYAFMLTGFLSKLYGEYLPGGSSICIQQTAKFIKPFYIGDKIKIVAEVINVIESVRFVEIKTEMYRNEKEIIFNGIGTVQILFERNLTQPLYEANNKYLYYSDFVNALREVGINKGDIVFVHSDISVFGKLCMFDRSILLETLIDAIKESVGDDGTIVMPTFTYSFCNGEIYDIANSKSTVGVLTEYFRKQPDVSRTIHPIFSVGISGKHKGDLVDINKDSFDKASIFGKFQQMNGKILFFGAPFQSCTHIHYIEQAHGVPYRHMKEFKGEIKDGHNVYEHTCTYFVRDLDSNVFLDTSQLEKHLLNAGLMRQARLGYGRILAIRANILFEEGCKLLDKDIRFFLKKDT